jgi:hypothetical protein
MDPAQAARHSMSESLARRVADAVEPELAAYRDFSDAPEGADCALRGAARLYDLVGEVQYSDLDWRWADPRGRGALLLLTTLADGYSLLAIGDEESLSDGALPDVGEARGVVQRLGVGDWVAEVRNGWSPDDAVLQPALGANPTSPTIEVDASLEDVRAREQRDGDQFDHTSWVAAEQVADWYEFYVEVSRGLASADDAPAAVRRMVDVRKTVVHELAYVRRWIPRCVRSGQRAEAIFGLSLVANMTRSLILGGLREYLEPPGAPHMMQIRDIKDMVIRYELEAWLAAPAGR